jgi:hypothetical protein
VLFEGLPEPIDLELDLYDHMQSDPEERKEVE